MINTVLPAMYVCDNLTASLPHPLLYTPVIYIQYTLKRRACHGVTL